MEISSQLTEYLLALGPWVVFIMTFAETAFIVGLVLPAEPAIIAACFLSMEGHFGLGSVVVATVAGGALGDTCGFWLGRTGGRRLLEGTGWFREMVRRHEVRTNRLIERYSVFAVSVGRVISFVRTLMPVIVGASELSYPRFLVYDLLGVALWATVSILLGVGVAVGWQVVGDVFGAWWPATLAVAALALWGLLVRRYRHPRKTD